MSDKMSADTNALNWFEIPMTDVERARKFYETAFDIQMESMDMMGMNMLMFPSDSMAGRSSGAIVKSEYHTPGTTGTIVYLNGNPDLQAVLDRIPEAGGQVTMPKTEISDGMGFMAFFIDSEGNSVAVHSNE